MKKHWETEGLIEHFTLLPEDFRLLGNKTGSTRLGFAVLLKFFQNEARFPANTNDIPPAILMYMAKQLQLKSDLFSQYPWTGRTYTNHRRQIRQHFGFHEKTNEDRKRMTKWLHQKVWDYAQEEEPLQEAVWEEYRRQKIELPASSTVKEMVRSAIHEQEQHFFKKPSINYLSKPLLKWMNSLIHGKTSMMVMKIAIA